MDPDKRPFEIIILCKEPLRFLYEEYLAELDDEIEANLEFVESPQEFASRCLLRPPGLGLVDIATLIRGSTAEMNSLFDFWMSWPVLRSKLDAKKQGHLMSTAPPRREPLCEAICEIARGGVSVWVKSSGSATRNFLRIPTDCRGRIREPGARDWNLVNLTDISLYGSQVVSYFPYPPGTTLELELADHPESPLILKVNVAWCREWEQSRSLPALGLRFEGEDHLAAVREFLATLDVHKLLGS